VVDELLHAAMNPVPMVPSMNVLRLKALTTLDRNLLAMTTGHHDGIALNVDGHDLEVPDDGSSLLDVLRDRLGIMSVKDGCSPQGQCGCCTVLVDGQPRVSCVTPARRVRGRKITTVDGLPSDVAARWAQAFHTTGGSQCGFCTPGIICRFEGLRTKGADHGDRGVAAKALQAHLCRCTGWQTIVDAWCEFGSEPTDGADRSDSELRAAIEGGTAQLVEPVVALGRGGFAADTAPADALVAVFDSTREEWVVADTRAEALRAAGKIQGRRTTGSWGPPIDVAPGEWAIELSTSWVEPAYLETDSAWCEPGGVPASPIANGGAFGSKMSGEIGAAAKKLAGEHGRPVLAVFTREDSVRRGPKRPPIAAGLRSDGTGIIRVARTPFIADVIHSVLPDVHVEEVDIAGPPTSSEIRGAGWVEAEILRAALRSEVGWIKAPSGGSATAAMADGAIHVEVKCGRALDPTVLRSYCIGAAHMALSWVTGESLAVDDEGEVHDLTIRSFGIIRAVDTPPIEVVVRPETTDPVRASDAVFAAVAAAVWLELGLVSRWPHTLGSPT